MIAAPSFDKNALKSLKGKKNLIILKIPYTKKQILEHKSTIFGDLYQTTSFQKNRQKIS